MLDDGYSLDSGILKWPLHVVVVRSACCGASDQRLVGRRLDGDGLLNQAVEELASASGLAGVEAEGEFVEVVVEMLVADGSLMRTQYPTLQ